MISQTPRTLTPNGLSDKRLRNDIVYPGLWAPGMANLFAELKRRHVYRVGAAYVVVAWALTQLVEILAQVFTLPLWMAQTAIVLLAVGFPVALFVAWTIESKPHEAVAAAVRSKPTIVDWTLCGALAVVLLFMGFQQIAPSAPMQQAGVDAQKEAAASPASAISLAVLPFTNLSSDPEQEFFSDGMTEEITAALARVPDLRVVGRTSAFQFKGQNEDLRAIGQRLSATHLVEGSVRKAGDRVRITVQLIKSDDGTHMWSQNYDRQLTDIFAIQEDIARTVTASLNMSLGLRPGENLVNNRNIDPDSYEKLLRAKGLYDGRGGVQNYAQAIPLVEDVISKHPDFAPAWSLMGVLYFGSANSTAANTGLPVAEARALATEFRTKGEAAARRAIQLDPNLTAGYSVLGILTWARGSPLEADALFAKVLELDRNDANALLGIAIRLGAAGRVEEAVATVERAHELEPFTPQISLDTAQNRWVSGQNDEALALAKTLRPINRAPTLAMIYATMGRYNEAADALTEVAGDQNSAAAQAARLLRTAPAKAESPNTLPRLPANLEFVYLHVNAPERVLAVYERRAEVGFVGGNQMAFVWHPSYAPVRRSERFKALMRKVGLVDYWRVKGWPDLCRPVGADDFACE